MREMMFDISLFYISICLYVEEPEFKLDSVPVYFISTAAFDVCSVVEESLLLIMLLYVQFHVQICFISLFKQLSAAPLVSIGSTHTQIPATKVIFFDKLAYVTFS